MTWTEHRTHQLRCRDCRSRTSAPLPGQIARSGFGPRLQAAVVTLTAAYRVSRRGVSELARDLFGARLSVGTIDAICQRASEALAGPHLQLQDWVLDQDAVHVDGTGSRTRGAGRALWTATTPQAMFLEITEHCNREQFNALIGTSYPGIVISDRWNSYSHLDPTRRQACWSHVKRDFRRHADGLGERRPSASKASAQAPRLRCVAGLRHKHHDRDPLKAEIAPIPTELRAYSRQGAPEGAQSLAPAVHEQPDQGLACAGPRLRRRGGADEQPCRACAPRTSDPRKISLGSQSDDGERVAGRALSAAGTCRLHTARIHLPQRTTHRPQPRRPLPRPGHLRPRELNAYRFRVPR